MGFQVGPRRSNVWDDVQAIDKIINDTNFARTLKNERGFENLFMSTLDARKKELKGKIHSQLDKDTSVRSVTMFGKRHRPDLTINEDGIAIEIKFLSNRLDGLKQAIGQSIIYRVRYRFVVNLLVIDEQNKEVYAKASNDEEKDLEDICLELSKDMNIFTYLVPAFSVDRGLKKILSWNDVDKGEDK